MGGSLAAAAGAAGMCWRASTALTPVSDAVKTLWLVCLSDPGEIVLLPCLRRSVVTATLTAAEKSDSFPRKFCLLHYRRQGMRLGALFSLVSDPPSRHCLGTAPKL